MPLRDDFEVRRDDRAGGVDGRGLPTAPFPQTSRSSPRLASRRTADAAARGPEAPRADLAACLKQAIERLSAVNDRAERAGRVLPAGPALIHALGTIERAEGILAQEATDEAIDAAITALRLALDGATAEISAFTACPVCD